MNGSCGEPSWKAASPSASKQRPASMPIIAANCVSGPNYHTIESLVQARAGATGRRYWQLGLHRGPGSHAALATSVHRGLMRLEDTCRAAELLNCMDATSKPGRTLVDSVASPPPQCCRRGAWSDGIGGVC
jgi:hypothetical protein